MHIDLSLTMIISFLQAIGLPVLLGIYSQTTKIRRANKLHHFKIEALVYAIQKELSTNGFTKAYSQKLTELKDEHKFVDKGL